MRNNSKAFISLTLAMAVINLFALGSFAYAPVPVHSTSSASPYWSNGPIVFQQQPGTSGNTGVLNGRGHLTINGTDVRTGATVVSGNTVGSGNGSYASIELGPPLGRIELRSDTTLTTTFAPGLVMNDFLQCGRMTETVPPGVTVAVRDPHQDTAKVIVKEGQVTVKYANGKEKVLTAGHSETFDQLNEVDTTGVCIFTVECGHHIAGLYWAGGGLLALLGVGLGLGLTTFNNGGSSSGPPPVLSGATP